MGDDLWNILLGLASAAVAAVIARLAHLVRQRRLRAETARRYPIAGDYISTYTDEMNGVSRTIRDTVTIKQLGSKFDGYSRNLDTGRQFNFEGQIVNDKYLAGNYWGEQREDESSGVFYLGLDLLQAGCIRGLWAGYGAESGTIISGEWNWRKVSQIDIAECLPSNPQLPAAAALLNDALGEGFVKTEDLEELATSNEGVVLLATNGRRKLEGVSTAYVMSETETEELGNKLVEAGARRLNTTNMKTGMLKSSAVVPRSRGQGVGLRMVNKRLIRLKEMGCSAVLVLSWDSGTTHSSLGVLEAAGFQRLASIAGYWREPEGEETFDCITCNGPCGCVAIVMRRSLYDFPDDEEPAGQRRLSWSRTS